MSKYFKSIKSYENLKAQYKVLLRDNHPDNGGDLEAMKEINVEYDALFPIWKNRREVETSTAINETADSTRRQFYTENGWEGSRYNSRMSTTEISKVIKMYCKEKYPTWKFSVTSKYFSGGSEILICVMEAPEQIFDLEACRKVYAEHLENEKMGYYCMRGLGMDIEKMLAEDKMYWQLHSINDTYKEYFTEYGFSVLSDVYGFMQSYNYDDSDGMIDYFDCNFYSSIYIGKWNKGFKVVPKTARIKNKATKPEKANKSIPMQKNATEETSTAIDNLTFEISEDIDTRTNEKIYLVKVAEKLNREDYIKVNKYIKSLGGYYSKFKHAFLFKEDPAALLKGNGQILEVEKQSKLQDRTKVVERINKAIDSTQNKINKLSGDYKTNTYKRMREQEGREAKIQGFKLDLYILSYLLNIAQERELTFFERALIIESFRDDIHAYYRRFETWNMTESKCPSSATPVTYPEKDLNYPNSWWNEEVPKRQKRLQKANISNTKELIEAIKEYKAIIEEVNKPQDQTELKIKLLERECKMMQKGDINFTPSEVAKRLIELARIEKGDKVLEPSAGIGSITDEIRKTTTNIDVVERMADFRELLLLKGYNLVGYDFLEYQSKPIYDAIIMNPPFSDEQNHIKHAYEMLKEGGTLISISSPHWTFANDKNSIEFREWLENETYFTEDLERGTFEMTNVSSKIIVIEKHIQAETRTA